MNTPYLKVQGSALTQTIILFSCTLSILMMIPIFAKLAHFSLIPDQASRYIAWKEVFGSYSTDEKDFLIDHILHDRNAPIQTQARSIKRDDREFWDNHWRLDAHNHHAVVEAESEVFSNRIDDIQIHSNTGPISGPNALMGLIEIENELILEIISGNEFLEDYRGLNSYQVSFSTDSMGLLENNLTFHAQHALIPDTWSANNPTEVKNNVNTFMPWSRAAPITDIISNLGYLPFFSELRHLEGSNDYVAPDRQRADRLGPRQ